VKQDPEVFDDVWVPTVCARCYCACGIRVRRVNGVAVKVEGEPNSTMGAAGGVCAKAEAGLQVLYDPNRLNAPLRRTNPEKGLFVDPKWKEISWEEALDEIANRLGKVMRDDPRKLLIIWAVLRNRVLLHRPWIDMKAHAWAGGGGLHCGAGAHVVAGMVHASWSIVPDFRYCNYAVYFGANKGSGSGHSAMITTRLAAEARARGAKFVVFDPMCNFAGGKATEWVPILPGTDGAVALAMANVIVNELGIWDDRYIKTKSNGPYLAGPDGRWVRDRKTKEPLVWDAIEAKVKVYDDPTIKDYALDGEYEVNGVKCRPAFHLLREHLKQYTPEMASEISTVPAATIRRIATEFAEAARIGGTITIDGHELPFRPASAVLFRGGEGHENSHHTCFAVSLLNQIIGGCDVPGGTLGWPARFLGYPGTGRGAFSPYKGEDGMVQIDRFGRPESPHEKRRYGGPWPHDEPESRGDASLRDIFTLGVSMPVWGSSDQEEIWQKVGLPYRPQMLIGWGCNVVMSVASRDAIANALKKIPFFALFELFSTELAEGFADILLPDTCYLEELNFVEGITGHNFNYPFGMDDWCFHLAQPVVEPKGNRRTFSDVSWELVDRLGYRAELNAALNEICGFDEEHKLKPDEKLTMEELTDKVLKYLFGPEHDLKWFKKHGFIRWPKKVEEVYWRYFIDARTQVYLEYMVDIGEKIKKIISEIGLNVDLSQYTPLIKWTPCSIHRVDNPEYDLYCFSYRDTLHTGSATMEQPWLDEASRMNPYTYNITMNRDTAIKKGIKDGDIIEIETVTGRKAEGAVKLMEGQHSQTVGIAACSGHWAKGLPIAKGKGTNFDDLLEIDLNHVDPVSQNLETAVRVKVRKVERS